MKAILSALMLGSLLTVCSQIDNPIQNTEEMNTTQEIHNQNLKMTITIDGVTHTAIFADTEAAKTLAEKLKKGPMNLSLNTNGDFEIWGDLCPLPASNEQYSAVPGDIVLYRERYICLLYGPYTYSYTRLGKLEGLSEKELRAFLKAGQYGVKVTLALAE